MSSTLNNDILIQSDLNYDALNDNTVVPTVDLSLFSVPNFNSNPVPNPTTVTNTLLTDKNVNGTGCFDNLMTSISKHLTNEFEEGRIEQDKFGDIYSQNMIQAMSIASQYVLNSVTTNYQNQLLKKQLEQQEINNIIAKVQLETTKTTATRARFEALTANANFTIAKQQLAVVNADYLFKLKQILLVTEQIDTERAKTKNTTATGSTITGILGKEKDLKDSQISLYEQQQNAYIVDSKAKIGMMFKDIYSINKSSDPGTTVPTSLNDANINEVVTAMRNAVDL
jgi:hypothetical protein